MTKKPWWKRIEVLAGFVVLVGGATVILNQGYSFVQNTEAKIVVEARKPYFESDHKPVYDSLGKVAKVVCEIKNKEDGRDSLMEMLYYITMENTSNDIKVRAMNRRNQDRRFTARRY